MTKVRLQPENKGVEVNAGETLLQAALRAGVPHMHACGGNGRCSTCRVIVLEGLENFEPRTVQEVALTDKK